MKAISRGIGLKIERKKFVFLASIFFIGIASLNAQSIDDQNKMWQRYDAIVEESEAFKDSLDADERKLLLNIVMENPVAKSSSSTIFDPPQHPGRPGGEIGYCYGRAMASHLLARKMGLKESSMRKIFAAGDMQNGRVRWRNHMATVVKGEDGKEYVIDPIMPGIIRRSTLPQAQDLDPLAPVTPKQWTELVADTYDNTEAILVKQPDLADNPNFTGTIKFYLASTEAMLVEMREVPALVELENGERIIEILFTPSKKVGFEAIYFSKEDKEAGKVGIWEVTDPKAESDFFMVKNEAIKDRFDFFKINLEILNIKDDQSIRIPLEYLFHGKLEPTFEAPFQHFSKGYFPSLLQTIEEFTDKFEDSSASNDIGRDSDHEEDRFTSEQAAQFIEKWFAALTLGEQSVEDAVSVLLAEYYTDETVLVDPNFDAPQKGLAILQSYYTSLFTKYPNWEFKVEKIYPTKEGLVLYYTGSVPGVVESFYGIDILEVNAEGKITKLIEGYDRSLFQDKIN